jgi:hypothetical protein
MSLLLRFLSAVLIRLELMCNGILVAFVILGDFVTKQLSLHRPVSSGKAEEKRQMGLKQCRKLRVINMLGSDAEKTERRAE